MEFRISYECSDVIEDLKADIAEFGAAAPAFGIWEEKTVRLPFSEKTVTQRLLTDYLLGDFPPDDLEEGELAILSTLGNLLPIFERENEIL